MCYFCRSSSQKTESSTIAFTETMAAKSIMEVDNPAEHSGRNTRSSNRSSQNSKQTAEKCKQINEEEETPIKYAEPHNFRSKQSFEDRRSPQVSTSKNWNNSKRISSMASRSTVSQNYPKCFIFTIFFKDSHFYIF